MFCRPDVLVIIHVILLPAICVTTYFIAVKLGHVSPIFPYISDTGSIPPESCVFGLLMTLYAFLCVLQTFIRYHHLDYFCTNNSSKCMARANAVALVLGLISSFGVLVVATFQQSNVLIVHMLGAGMLFCGSHLYFWVQTVLSYKLKDISGSCRKVAHIRLCLTLIHLVSCVGMVTCGVIGMWTSPHEIIYLYIWSTSLEWVAVMLSSIFILTFFGEFRRFRFSTFNIHFSGIADKADNT